MFITSDQEVSSNPTDVEEDDLKEITFGALAQAQASFTPNPKKRKLDQRDTIYEASNRPVSYNDQTSDPSHEPKSTRKPSSNTSRTSKHAPQVQTSRHAVPRHRNIFEPSPAHKARDPRFDATVTSTGPGSTSRIHSANQNYSFLSDYRANEITTLKSQLKKTTQDPALAAGLRRQIASLESHQRTSTARQREREIQRQHRAKEREAIRSGAKSTPYHLKHSEVRKQVVEERLEGMSKKALDRAEVRKEKKQKHKDAKDMPRARRE